MSTLTENSIIKSAIVMPDQMKVFAFEDDPSSPMFTAFKAFFDTVRNFQDYFTFVETNRLPELNVFLLTVNQFNTTHQAVVTLEKFEAIVNARYPHRDIEPIEVYPGCTINRIYMFDVNRP